MFPISVVVIDRLRNLLVSSSHALIFVEFILERTEARFRKGIVIAVVRAGHTLDGSSTTEDGSIALCSVLAATVCVMNQTMLRTAMGDRRANGF